jgi:drug/metabolite transporter (DMT)-like permease
MQGKVSTKVYVYIAAVLSMFFWGMSFIWTSIVFEYFPPITTIFFRLLISSLLLLAFLSAFGYLQKIRREHLWLLIASAVFNPFFYFIGENYGLKYSTPSITAIMIATIPIVTPFIAWFSIRERVGLHNIYGICISFLGIMIMLVNPDMSLATEPAGIIFLLFAVFSAVFYSILVKKLTLYYSPVNIITWQNVFGTLLFIPLVLIIDSGSLTHFTWDTRLIGALVSLAVFASSLAFIFFASVIKHLGVNRANVYGNLIPVVTAFASFYLLGEEFNTKKVAGMVIVILGVFVSQIKQRKR